MEEVKTVKGKRYFDGAWLEKKNGIYLLHLKGDNCQMAYQHGRLMKDEIRDGFLHILHRYIKQLIFHTRLGRLWPARLLALKYIHAKFYSPIIKKIPPEYRDEVYALADGAGLPRRMILETCVISDVLLNSLAMLYHNRMQYRRHSALGCTSFVAANRATVDGELIHGRNLDFDGMGYWDKYPTVVFCQPEEGMWYVMFTTAGFHSAGNTGINESGIVLNTHINLSADTSTRGTPIWIIGEKVIRKARSIKDAIETLKKFRPTVGWTFVISDAKKKDAVSVELSAKNMSVRRMDGGILWNSNNYISEELKEGELCINRSTSLNFEARYRRMKDLLEQNYGKIDIPKAIEFLGDHWDIYTNRTRATGDVIAQFNNLMSMIISSNEHKFWIANGPAPACNSTYVGFDILHEMTPVKDEKPLSLYKDKKFYGTRNYQGLRKYIEAEGAYFWDNDCGKAYKLLSEAIALDLNEPFYLQTKGLLCLKLGKFEEAKEVLNRALGLPQNDHKIATNHLWLGRSYDLLKERNKALDEYRQTLQNNDLDHRIRESAEMGLLKAYSSRKAARIEIDFYSGEPIEY